VRVTGHQKRRKAGNWDFSTIKKRGGSSWGGLTQAGNGLVGGSRDSERGAWKESRGQKWEKRKVLARKQNNFLGRM